MNKESRLRAVLRNVSSGLILLVIVVLFVLAVRNLIISNKEQKAEDNARIIYIAAGKWISQAQSKNITLANSHSGDEIIFKSESMNSNKSAANDQNNFNEMDLTEFLNGSLGGDWCVVVDKDTLKVSYALWSEDKIPDNKIKKPDDIPLPQHFFKDWNNIIGCY